MYSELTRRAFGKLLGGAPLGYLSAPDDDADVDLVVSTSRDVLAMDLVEIYDAMRELQSAIDEALPAADVRVRFGDVLDVDQTFGTAEDALWWWQEENDLDVDAHVLLLQQSGSGWENNGYAVVGGRAGVVGVEEDWIASKYFDWLCIHEAGHCLGLRHSDGEAVEKVKRTAMSAAKEVNAVQRPEFSGQAVDRLREIYPEGDPDA